MRKRSLLPQLRKSHYGQPKVIRVRKNQNQLKRPKSQNPNKKEQELFFLQALKAFLDQIKAKMRSLQRN